MCDGHVAAALGVVLRGGDAHTKRGEFVVDALHEKIGLCERLGTQRGDAAGFGDQLQRAEQRRDREDMRRAEMQRSGARGRLVVRGHRKATIRAHPPPAGESRRATEVPTI